MTGPEHYREGEKQLQDAKDQASDGFHDEAAVTTQLAIAHFAAAQAAAQAAAEALRTIGEWFEIEQEAEEWCKAIQVKRATAEDAP